MSDTSAPSAQPVSSVLLPTFDTLLLNIADCVATVTLSRPSVLNALNAQLFNDLERVFQFLAQDPGTRAVVITGAGEKAFAAGADIAELADIPDAAAGEKLSLRVQSVLRLLDTSSKPVVAAINGFALGGGLELALACTLRLAAETAKLGQPEVKLGLLPGYGGTQRLPRLIGRSAALKLLLTGEMITAGDALRLGLVDEVVPAADLADRTHALAARIANGPQLALAATLEAVREGMYLPLEEGLALEAHLFGKLFDTADKKEGVAAFLDKRPARWIGE